MRMGRRGQASEGLEGHSTGLSCHPELKGLSEMSTIPMAHSLSGTTRAFLALVLAGMLAFAILPGVAGAVSSPLGGVVGSIEYNCYFGTWSIRINSMNASDCSSLRAWWGIAEFNLSAIAPMPNASVHLTMGDSLSTSGNWGHTITELYAYWGTGSTADGQVTYADRDSPATYVTSIERWEPADNWTDLDVTSLVNGVGSGWLGFRVQILVAEGFGWFNGYLPTLWYSDQPAVIAEPGTLLLLGSGLAGVVAWRRRRAGREKARCAQKGYLT